MSVPIPLRQGFDAPQLRGVAKKTKDGLPQGLLGDGDAELLEDPLRQINQPPAHHAVEVCETGRDHFPARRPCPLAPWASESDRRCDRQLHRHRPHQVQWDDTGEVTHCPKANLELVLHA